MRTLKFRFDRIIVRRVISNNKIPQLRVIIPQLEFQGQPCILAIHNGRVALITHIS